MNYFLVYDILARHVLSQNTTAILSTTPTTPYGGGLTDNIYGDSQPTHPVYFLDEALWSGFIELNLYGGLVTNLWREDRT